MLRLMPNAPFLLFFPSVSQGLCRYIIICVLFEVSQQFDDTNMFMHSSAHRLFQTCILGHLTVAFKSRFAIFLLQLIVHASLLMYA